MLWSRLAGIVLLLGLSAGPALSQAQSLSGSVSYRERVALPADAFLQVTLVELPSGAAVAGAAAAVPARGGPPIAFTLNVHNGLRGDRRYGLVADISSRGRVFFRTTQPVAVAGSAPTAIVLAFAPGPVPQQPEEPAELPIDFAGIVWTVTSVGGRPASGDRTLTLSIAADMRAGGSAGCNDYFTEASLSQDRLEFGPAAATRMVCDSTIMVQEADFLAALAAVRGFEREGPSLRLLDAAGIPLIGLVNDAE